MICFLPKSSPVIHGHATYLPNKNSSPFSIISHLSPCQASLSPSSSPSRSSMAAVQSLTVTRPPSAVLAPISASSVSSLPASLRSVTLPAFSGLRIRSATSVRQLRPVRFAARRAGRTVCESPETATEAPPVTDSTWQSLVLDSDTPVLVEFWAPWCGPCRMIHPVIDELAKQYSGKLKCFKVNTDESPSIATRYGIRSIPTVIIFKNGEKKEAVIGAVPKATLTSSIDKFL